MGPIHFLKKIIKRQCKIKKVGKNEKRDKNVNIYLKYIL